MNSIYASKVLPDGPSSDLPPWEWLTHTELDHDDHDYYLPQTPRLRPVRSSSRLSTPSSPTTPTGIDAESYIPNIQLAERAKVVFSGKAIMVNYAGRRASMGEGPSPTGVISRDVRRRSLNEARHGVTGLEGYQDSDQGSNYRTSSGAPERNSVTLRRLRSSTGRPRVETIPGVNKNTTAGMRESIWWQSEFNIDGARLFSPRSP